MLTITISGFTDSVVVKAHGRTSDADLPDVMTKQAGVASMISTTKIPEPFLMISSMFTYIR